MSTDTTPSGPYSEITIRGVFAWLDTLRGWDIATHVEYESLRDIALARLDALETDLAAERGRGDRLREALRVVAAVADERGTRLSPSYPSALGEGAQSELGLHPGDLDEREARS